MERSHMLNSDLQRRYFNTAEAAHYSGVSQKRLEKMRCSGGGPRYFKRGRSVRYSLADLDAWMQAGAQSSTSDLVAA
jgi:predicted DNA-binding transcriptional regulator AlpA